MALIHTDGILLDIDGTIWDSRELAAKGWNRAIRKYGINMPPVTAERLKSLFGKTMDVIAQELFPSVPAEQVKPLYAECFRQEHIELEKNMTDITYPSVCDTIRQLSRTYKIFIVSNCQNGYIEQLLRKTGLAPYISDSECFGKTGKDKAYNIRLLSDRNNLKAPVYVGDTQGDSESSAAAGVPFIWASYGFGSPQSYDAKIETFAELETVVCLLG